MKEENMETLVSGLFKALGAKPEQVKQILGGNPVATIEEAKKEQNNTPSKSNTSVPNSSYDPSYGGMGYGMGNPSVLNPGMSAYGTQATQMNMRGGPTSFQNIAQAQNMSQLADASMMRYRALSQQEQAAQGKNNNADKAAFTDEMFSKDSYKKFLNGSKEVEKAPAFKDEMFSKEAYKQFLSEEANANVKSGLKVASGTAAPTLSPPTPFDAFLDNIRKLMPGTDNGNTLKAKLESLGVEFNETIKSTIKTLGLDKIDGVNDLLKKEENKVTATNSQVNPQVPAPSVNAPAPIEKTLNEVKESLSKPIDPSVLNMERTASKVNEMLEAEAATLKEEKKDTYRHHFY